MSLKLSLAGVLTGLFVTQAAAQNFKIPDDLDAYYTTAARIAGETLRLCTPSIILNGARTGVHLDTFAMLANVVSPYDISQGGTLYRENKAMVESLEQAGVLIYVQYSMNVQTGVTAIYYKAADATTRDVLVIDSLNETYYGNDRHIRTLVTDILSGTITVAPGGAHVLYQRTRTGKDFDHISLPPGTLEFTASRDQVKIGKNPCVDVPRVTIK